MSRESIMDTRRDRLIFLEAISHLISIKKLPSIDYNMFKINTNRTTVKSINVWLNQLQEHLRVLGMSIKITKRPKDQRIIRAPYFKCNSSSLCFKYFNTGTVLGKITKDSSNEEFFIMELLDNVEVNTPTIETHHLGLHNDFEVVWINKQDPMDVAIFNFNSEEEVEAHTGLTYRGGKLYKKNGTCEMRTPFIG